MNGESEDANSANTLGSLIYQNFVYTYARSCAPYILEDPTLQCLLSSSNYFWCNVVGHTIFEMSSGQELIGFLPTAEDYELVDAELREVLEFIFKRKNENKFKNSISKVSKAN